MLKNYLKIAIRNFWKHRYFSLINIAGLSVGMTAFFLIILYVSFEKSYDNFNTRADRIYRLVTDIKTPTELIHAASTSAPMAVNLRGDFPEIQSIARIYHGSYLIQRTDVKFQEENLLFADSSLFTIFDLPLIEGDKNSALKLPFSIVLSETAARKYFGTSDPVGKTLSLNGTYTAQVTGLMKNIPDNSHFKADVLVSMTTLESLNKGLNDNWGNFGWYTYLLLPEGSKPGTLEARFPDFMLNHVGKTDKNNTAFSIFLEPLKQVYLDTERESSGIESGNRSNIHIFSIIAAFILIVAAINYVNLTTAKSVERSKEVGLKKVFGASRKQLTFQFLGESLLLCLISFLFSVLLSFLLLPFFNQLAGKTISDGLFRHPIDILSLFVISLVIGLVAGLYPAFVISGYKPASTVRGGYSSSTRGIFLRKALVITQFSISIALISGTLIIFRQLVFMRDQPLGFKKQQMLVINFRHDDFVQKNYMTLENSLLSIPNVLSASISSGLPGYPNDQAATQVENRNGLMQSANFDMYSVDFDFLKQYEIQAIAGRLFSRQFGTDSIKSLVVNEAVVKELGYSSPQDIVGKHFSQWGREGTIIGVIKDFHFRSLQEAIKPLTIRVAPDNTGFMSLNISAGNVSSTLADIKSKWDYLVPELPFNYSFVDQTFSKQYRAEEQFGSLFLCFSILAIFISCMGLLGLAAYTTLQRKREIGVRKVIGASVSDITLLLSKEFITLVSVSMVIATPIAWIWMNKWLRNFAYREGSIWWIFLLTGLLVIILALATVSFHSIKAAIANPMKSLKVE